MSPDSDFLDRLIERLDRLDPSSVQGYVLRLVQEKGFLETIFNTIQEGIAVIDRDLKIRYANPAARELLGLGGDGSGLPVNRLLRDVEWQRLMSADPRQWQRMSFHELEIFYPVHRFISFYLVPMQTEHAHETSIPIAAIIMRDVTNLHADTEKAIESGRIHAITMLVAGVAHEVGNPLNSLNIHLQLLQRCLARTDSDNDIRDEAQELLRIASAEVSRLDGIVNSFLQAVRPETPVMKQVWLRELLTEVLEFLRPEIEAENVLVEASWPAQVPGIKADPAQLKQVFHNIVRNAVQAMPDGGVLRINCRESNNEFIEVSIADTGCGIRLEDLGRVTDPFFTTKTKGTGLGLMVVDRIIRSHGGELGIETELGKGTVFFVRLPLRQRRVRLLQEAGGSSESMVIEAENVSDRKKELSENE